MSHLRMTVADWDVDLDSADGVAMVGAISDAGVAVFRAQPGFVSYRLMRAGPRRTVAVAEWRTEEESLAGSARYREWLATAGIRVHITMDTEAGPVVATAEGVNT